MPVEEQKGAAKNLEGEVGGGAQGREQKVREEAHSGGNGKGIGRKRSNKKSSRRPPARKKRKTPGSGNASSSSSPADGVGSPSPPGTPVSRLDQLWS